MKFLKCFLILLVIALNQSITSLETTKVFKMKSLFHKRKSTNHKKTHSTRVSHKAHHSTMMHHHASSARYKMHTHMSREKTHASITTQTKEFVTGAILAGIMFAMRVGSEVLIYLTNKKNFQSLNVMNQELDKNKQILRELKDNEVDSCSKVKLIVETNKNFFVMSEFRTAFFDIFKSNLQKNRSTDPKKKPREDHDLKTVEDLIQIRKKSEGLSAEVSRTLKRIEDDLCEPDTTFEIYNARNEVLAKRIKEVEAELESRENGILENVINQGFKAGMDYNAISTAYGYGVDANENALVKDADASKFTWSALDGEDSATTFDKNYITSFINNGIGAIKGSAEMIEYFEEYAKTDKSKRTKVQKLTLGIKILNAINAILNVVHWGAPTAHSMAIIGIIKGVSHLLVKLIELGIAIYQFVKAKNEGKSSWETIGLKKEMYRAGIEVVGAVITMAWWPISGVVLEGLHFGRRLIAFIQAKKRLEMQTNEFNYYKLLGDLHVKNQKNMSNYNICLANFVSTKSIYEVLLDMDNDSSMSPQDSAKMFETIFGQSDAKAAPQVQQQEFAAKKALLKTEIEKICDRNLQFCSRNLNENILVQMGFLPVEIAKMKDLTINGPYTDLVVSKDQNLSMSFIQLGYEPVAENILGCRMCSNTHLIRHAQIVSETEKTDTSDPLKNLRLGQYIDGKRFCNDYQDCNIALAVKTYRIDRKNFLVYEVIDSTISPSSKRLATLYRFNYYSLKKSKLNKGKKWAQNERPYVYRGQIGYWNAVEKKWLDCAPNCTPAQSVKDTPLVRVFPKSITADTKISMSKNTSGDESRKLSTFPLYGHNHFLNNQVLDLSIEKQPIFIMYGETNTQNPITAEYTTGKFLNGYIAIPQNVDVKVKPGHYNWIVYNSDYEYNTLNKLNEIYPATSGSNIISPVPAEYVISTYSSSEPTEVVKRDFMFLVQFSPFAVKTNLSTSNDAVNNSMNCNSVCEVPDLREGNPESKCAFAQDIPHNFYSNPQAHKLSDGSDKIEEIIQDPIFSTFREKYKGKYAIKSDNHLINDDILNKEFADSFEMGTFNVKVHEVRIDWLESSKKLKETYLWLQSNEKETKLTAKYYNEASFQDWLKSKEDVASDRIFFTKLKDIHPVFYIIYTHDLDFVDSLLSKLNDFSLVENLYLEKGVTNAKHLIVLAKPLSTFGFVPFQDISYSTVRDQNCWDEFFKNLSPDFCLKNMTNACHIPRRVPESIKSKPNIQKAINVNLTKAMWAKAFKSRASVGTISHNFDNIFNPGFKFSSCDRLDIYLPVSFIKPETKANFNKLKIVNKKLVENSDDDFGPEIRSIYWVRLSTSAALEYQTDSKKMNEDSKINHAKALEVITPYGFTQFDARKTLGQEPISITVGGKPIYLTAFVSYDYRLKLDRTEICEMCKQVRKNFTPKKST
jgi:hypothetical protein